MTSENPSTALEERDVRDEIESEVQPVLGENAEKKVRAVRRAPKLVDPVKLPEDRILVSQDLSYDSDPSPVSRGVTPDSEIKIVPLTPPPDLYPDLVRKDSEEPAPAEADPETAELVPISEEYIKLFTDLDQLKGYLSQLPEVKESKGTPVSGTTLAMHIAEIESTNNSPLELITSNYGLREKVAELFEQKYQRKPYSLVGAESQLEQVVQDKSKNKYETEEISKAEASSKITEEQIARFTSLEELKTYLAQQDSISIGSERVTGLALVARINMVEHGYHHPIELITRQYGLREKVWTLLKEKDNKDPYSLGVAEQQIKKVEEAKKKPGLFKRVMGLFKKK
jgi:hypothetical protein